MDEVEYLKDSYKKEFETKVKKVKDKFVVLENTIFYPNSGGQPHDEGKIIRDSDEFKVVYVGKFDGEISHEVDKEGLKEGDEVKLVLDWERRYKLMRSHTAAHLVSAIFHNEAGAKITGNQLNLDKTRIDFSLDEFDKEKIIEYIEKCNEYIEKDLKVTDSYMSREEVEKNPDLVKLAKGLPEGIKELRMLEIEGLDKQPDGGTHVKSLKEIGKIVFVKADNKGAKNRRVYFSLEDANNNC
ncbi:alanyl-tRNA editing protein [archaeon]|nr:alanyl-tRNA editing protein [archaeon]